MVSIRVRSKPLPCVQRNKRLDLVLVHAAERHRVDLDLDAGAVGRVDAVHHLREIAPAGDRLELRRIERVERDIDAGDAAVRERLGIAGELAAIGGERELVEAGAEMPRQRLDQPHEVLAHQRLAAGEPAPCARPWR